MKTAYIIANPSSGKREAENYSIILKEMYEENEINATIFLTESEDDIVDFTEKACQDEVDDLILIGGDGTISKAISSMQEYQSKPTIGIIPSGTVNNIAKGLAIDTDAEEAIKQLFASKEIPIDVGQINDQLFVSSISAGTIPETVWEVEDDLKEKVGPLAYFLEGFKKVANEEPYTFQLEWDGETKEEELIHLLIGVSSSVLGYTNFFRQATYNDGNLYLFGIRESSFGEKITGFSKHLNNETSIESNDSIFSFGFKEATIHLKDKNRPVALDGDKGPEFPVTIKCLPKFLKVYVPIDEE